MQLCFLLLDLIEQAALNAIRTPGSPFLQDLAHTHNSGHTGNENIEIAGKGILQRGQPEQFLHQFVRFHAPLQVDGQLQTAQVGLITHIGNFLDLAGFDQLRHLVHNDFAGGGIGDLRNLNEVTFLHIVPFGPEFKAATAIVIDLTGGGLVKQKLGAGGEIGTGQSLQNIVLGILHQRNGSIADFR